MQNKKVTMLAAVLAVTVIAMAGVGYAVVYKATTTNSGNGMDNTYLELTQDGVGKYAAENFLTELYFDTTNPSQGTITYTPVCTHVEGAKGENYAVEGDKDTALISTALGLKIRAVNSDEETVSMEVSATGFTPTGTGLKYTMVLTKNYAPNAAFQVYDKADLIEGKWSFSGIEITNNATESYTVLLFVTADASNGTINGTTGFSNATDKNTVFTFEISADTEA